MMINNLPKPTLHSLSFYICLFFLAVLTCFSTSCNIDEFKDFEDATVQQSAAFAIPVGKVGFTLEDLLEEDTVLTFDADNGIHLIYREDDFIEINADEILDEIIDDMDDTYSQQSAIGTQSLEGVSQQFDMTFGSLVEKFQDPVLQSFFQQNDGVSISVPSFQESFVNEVDVPAFTQYEYMDVESGLLQLTLENQLFLPVQNFSVTVEDVVTGNTLGTFVYDYLAVGETETSEIDISGKSVSNQFRVYVSDLQSPGSSGSSVVIDLNDLIVGTFETSDIVVSGGKVNLDPGVLTEDQYSFFFSSNYDERIYNVLMNNARLNYSIASDIQTEILLRMTFIDVLRNNMPVVYEISVVPAPPGAPVTGTLDFSNTVWRLDQDPDQPYNRFRVDYEVIKPDNGSGQLIFSSGDQVSIDFNLGDLDIAQAEGFFGFRNEDFEDGSFDLGFDFARFGDDSSPLIFDNPEMRIDIENSFGIPLLIEFNAEAQGAFGESAFLNPPKLNVNYPDVGEAGQVLSTAFAIDKYNSNVVGLLAVYPELVTYSGSAVINPENDLQAINFVRGDSKLTASAEFDLPFTFRVQSLVYRDTLDAADLKLNDGLYAIEDVDSANMKIVYESQLPLHSTVSVFALRADGTTFPIIEELPFEPAMPNGFGRVEASGILTSEVYTSLTKQQVLELHDATGYLYEIRLQTAGNGQVPVALYTDYKAEVRTGIVIAFRKNG